MATKGGGSALPEAYRGREQAYIKHRLLEDYLEKLFLIVGMSARELDIKSISYVDCFAGPWGDESESLSSTSIAISLRVLASCHVALRKLGIDLHFRALYIEQDPKAFTRLKQYLAQRESDGIAAEATQGDFVELIPAIQEWCDRPTFAFFFIDPKAWLPVSVGVLKPLLERPQSEFLINFMYDFANRAVSMGELRRQTTQLLGEAPDVGDLHGLEREKELLGIYRRNLKSLAPSRRQWPARCAYARVLDRLKNRPKYHLVYLTTHPRGLVEFMEVLEHLDVVQKEVRAATRQHRREEASGIRELFEDAEYVREDEGHVSQGQVERYWLNRLTSEPRRFGYPEFADMLEDTDWFPGDFQRALGSLMEAGKVLNLDARGKRWKKFLHLDSGGEQLQRVEGAT